MLKKLKVFILSMAVVSTAYSQNNKIYDPVCGEGYYILTPKESDKPNINSAEVFGVRPGNPFLYTIAATGVRPMEFYAENLPNGLTLDVKSGTISGTIESKEVKSYNVLLKCKNSKGKAEQTLEIKVGEDICLTPPLGWNSWNCWGSVVTQANVEASAKAMCDKGLINYGWSFINIDDGWQGNVRGGKFHAIQPDPVDFPDMQGMCDRIHAMGLKVGIYSTPWITSYAKYIGGSSDYEHGYWDETMKDPSGPNTPIEKEHWQVGKYKFDINDAKQWAEWGIDYLKYDWWPNDSTSTVRMSKALRASGRDIIYSLSNSAPMDLVDVCAEYVQCWRTTGDLKDRWSDKGIHQAICDVLPIHREWVNKNYSGKPGHFADPDMLVVGHMFRGNGKEMTPSRLTADEQYSHIAYWSLWSAPLLLGCPVERLDDFTVALLSNNEVLDIQQDRNAIPGKTVLVNDNVEIIVKELHNGNKAIGIFNLSDSKAPITVDWKTLGLTGKQKLRDAWRQEDIGTYKDEFTAVVPSHGNVLLTVEAR